MRQDNLTIIDTTDKEAILGVLRDCGITVGHFTNGTYTGPAEKVIPTTLAGFEFISNTRLQKSEAMIIAVNSDHSMQNLFDARLRAANTLEERGVVNAERILLENQYIRAEKVTQPLALQHAPSGTNVVAIFYDEDTPTDLYDFLATNGFGMRSLHKWGGYGLDKKAMIEGAEFFGEVLAFPFFDKNAQPFAYGITRAGDQTEIVKRVNLYREEDGHPAYLSEGGKILFNIRHSLASLAERFSIVDGTSRQWSP